jgi:OmpR family response regulator RpaB
MDTIKPKKIIVAEDDTAMSGILNHKLSTVGFNVRVAVNGLKAMEMFREDPPDLILLDLMMPEMDGFEVLKRVRGNPDKKLANTPVIILSNLRINEDVIRARSFNISDYIVKAYFTPDDILAKVKAVLKN